MYSGLLRLSQVVIERATSSADGYIGWLGQQQGATGSSRLLVMTLVEMRPGLCGGQFLVQTAPSDVVLRSIKYKHPTSCDLSSPNSFANASGIKPISCGGRYIETCPDSELPCEYGVCASDADGACSSVPMVGTPLQSTSW